MAAESSRATYYRLDQLALRGTALEMREKGQLFSLLKRAHLLPNLPEPLRGLTFPELLLEQPDPTHQPHNEEGLSRSHPLFAALNRLINSLEEHQGIDPLLREIRELYSSYIDEACAAHGEDRWRFLSGPVRLFALLYEGSLSLFSAQRGESVTSIGCYSTDSFGIVPSFGNCDRSALERIFPQRFSEGVAALVSGLPKGAVQIEEVSLFGALQCWILPYLKTTEVSEQAATLEQLFLRFPDLIRSEEFLHLLAEQGSPNFIRFAISQGVEIKGVDRRRRTLFHCAAQAGQIENAYVLIELGAEIDARDLDGRTPLHLAALQGNQPMVKALLEIRADPSLVTPEGETLLHIAAGGGNIDLVAFLLGQPFSKEWLHHGDSDGKVPLHLAVWGDPKPGVVHLLIEVGTHVDMTNSYGYTALHWAAKHGHLESARLLLKAGAQIDILNQNGDSPFDLALNWGQDEIVWLFLGGGNLPTPQAPSSSCSPPPSSSSSPSSPLSTSLLVEQQTIPFDPEGVAYRAFEAAYESGNTIAQIFWLQKMAQMHIEKKSYITAAHLLNGALVLTEDSLVNPACRAFIFSQLERLEGLFLFDLCERKTPAHHRNYLARYREELQRVRSLVIDCLDQSAIEEVQELLTRSYQAILVSLINESIDLMGRGYPDGFAVMGLGSIARLEASPHSDIEFAFLVRDSSLKRMSYLRKLSQLLTLKMINMGETKCELLRFKRGKGNEEDLSAKSLVPTGFSLDIGGLCPSGKSGVYELIGTPKELARFQTKEWLGRNDAEIILANAMTTVSYLIGDSDLIVAYQREIHQILDANVRGFLSWSRRKLRQDRALELMRGFVEEFEPKLDQDKIDLRGFDVKKELYRLPQTVISGLALYFGLKSSNTIQKIGELEHKKLISAAGAKQLKQAFRSILKLRVQTHLFYGTEREVLYYAHSVDGIGAEKLLIISPEIKTELIEIYRVLIPLHQTAQAFLRGDERVFSRSSFYDERIGAYEDSARVKFQYAHALTSAQSSAALDPDNPVLRRSLGVVQYELGEARSAITNHKQALLVLKQKYGDVPSLEVADTLRHLGNAYDSAKKHYKAMNAYNSAISIYETITQGQPHPDLAMAINNLGNVYLHINQFNEARDCYTRSLLMKKNLYGDVPRIDTAMTLHNLGSVYKSLQNYEQAMDYAQQALLMNKQIYHDEPNPVLGSILGGLANIYRALGEYSLAIKYSKEALKIKQKIYKDRSHPDIAGVLENIGNNLSDLDEYREAIQYHEMALKMRKEIHDGKLHISIANSMHNLGNAYHGLKEYKTAIKKYEIALKIKLEFYNSVPHASIANTLMQLGNSYSFVGKIEKSIELLQRAHEMYATVVGIDHPDTQRAQMKLDFVLEIQEKISSIFGSLSSSHQNDSSQDSESN